MSVHSNVAQASDTQRRAAAVGQLSQWLMEAEAAAALHKPKWVLWGVHTDRHTRPVHGCMQSDCTAESHMQSRMLCAPPGFANIAIAPCMLQSQPVYRHYHQI